jgi:hypothetical protein
MGFDFAVEYRAGKQNKVADALSRRLEDQPGLASLLMPPLTSFLFHSHQDSKFKPIATVEAKYTARQSYGALGV